LRSRVEEREREINTFLSPVTVSPGEKYKVKMAKIQSKIQEISYVFLYVKTVPGKVPAKREAQFPAKYEAASRQKGSASRHLIGHFPPKAA
jgi:hypothetical protein